MTMPENRHPLTRVALLGLGLICLGLAGLGFVLPGLPGTPFLLLAAACFARSSRRLHDWLLENKIFGPVISNWQESRSIPRRVKQIAILSVLVAAGLSLAAFDNPYFRLALLVSLSVPLVILARLRETEPLALTK